MSNEVENSAQAQNSSDKSSEINNSQKLAMSRHELEFTSREVTH